MNRGGAVCYPPRPHDPARFRLQAARPADPLPRRVAGAFFAASKVGLVGPERRGEVHHLPPDRQGRAAGRRARSSVDRGTTIGYFSQDVGEMRGRSVVAETHRRRRRPVADGRRASCTSSSTRSPIPSAPTSWTGCIERFGEVQARFEELGGYGARGARARDPGRPRLRARARSTATSARSPAAGRCASRSRASCLMKPGRAAARRADQPPRHRVDHLARELPQELRGRARA